MNRRERIVRLQQEVRDLAQALANANKLIVALTDQVEMAQALSRAIDRQKVLLALAEARLEQETVALALRGIRDLEEMLGDDEH